MVEEDLQTLMNIIGWTIAHVACCEKDETAVIAELENNLRIPPTMIGTPFICFAASAGCHRVVSHIIWGPHGETLGDWEKKSAIVAAIVNQHFNVFETLIIAGYGDLLSEEDIAMVKSEDKNVMAFVNELKKWRAGERDSLAAFGKILDGNFYEGKSDLEVKRMITLCQRSVLEGQGIIIRALGLLSDGDAKEIINKHAKDLNKSSVIFKGDTTPLMYAVATGRWEMVKYLINMPEIDKDDVEKGVNDCCTTKDFRAAEVLMSGPQKIFLLPAVVRVVRKSMFSEFLLYHLQKKTAKGMKVMIEELIQQHEKDACTALWKGEMDRNHYRVGQ